MTDDLTRSFDQPPASPAAPAVPPAPDPGGSRAPDLRTGLGRLSRGLIIYGIVGLIVACLGLAALAFVNSRIDAAAERVEASVDQLATTLDRTATALHDASTTAQTFTVTIDRTEESVSAAADTIIGVRTSLESLEGVLRTVNILGLTPLGPASDAVGTIADAIEGLDSRLTGIADSLAANQGALDANASSLGQLGDSLEATADRLRSGIVEESLADVNLVILTMLLVLTAWTMVPALGALALGWWLRRNLGRR
ncbi:MAG: hypothetical protein OEX05_11140 [Chloroflexota bacterium]|nr:hypothetical protein [Chloroflexota bacterium]